VAADSFVHEVERIEERPLEFEGKQRKDKMMATSK